MTEAMVAVPPDTTPMVGLAPPRVRVLPVTI
jgi:hypothetical protein